MKKIANIFSILLVVALLLCTTSCKKNDFNFDDEYFVGIQEHIYEIRQMEPTSNLEFVCDFIEALDTKVFRLNVTMNNLFYVDTNDTVKFNQSKKNAMRQVVDALKEAGVERIVYSTDTFIYPYGYKATHTKCVPNPYSEKAAYIRFLKVNAEGYKLIAENFPEIQYFELINEPDIPNNEVIVKNGMLWGQGSSQFMYSAQDEANICVDLCYYGRQAITSVNKDNKMMGPALSSLASCLDYIGYMYEAIESGSHPTGDDLACSVDPDDYFDILDIHPYASVCQISNPEVQKENDVVLITEDYVKSCNMFYELCCKHGDSEKPHWYTEIGYSDYGDANRREIIGRETTKQLKAIKEELPYVECVIYYVLSDLYDMSVSISEDHFGLVTAPNDEDEPLLIKPILKSLYSFTHDGSTDYSSLEAFRNKYIGE